METSFWKWESAIPGPVCNELLREVAEKQLKDGRVNSGDEQVVNTDLRNGKIVFLKQNHWFEGILLNHARWANESANWNFQMDACEPIQVASYKAGEKYDWHTDEGMFVKDKPYHRKLSVICQLSKAEDFTGGGLFVDGAGEESVLKNQGDLVVFPSMLLHKAAEVTSGHRLTVVCWMTGRHFT